MGVAPRQGFGRMIALAQLQRAKMDTKTRLRAQHSSSRACQRRAVLRSGDGNAGPGQWREVDLTAWTCGLLTLRFVVHKGRDEISARPERRKRPRITSAMGFIPG